MCRVDMILVSTALLNAKSVDVVALESILFQVWLVARFACSVVPVRSERWFCER